MTMQPRRERASLLSVRVLLWTTLPWLALLLVKTLESMAGMRLRGDTFTFLSLLRGEIPIIAVGILVTPAALWLGFRLPLTAATWRPRLLLLAPAACALVVVINVIRANLWALTGVQDAPASAILLTSLTTVFHIDLINVSFMIAAGQLLWFLRDRREKALRASRLEAQLTEARLHVLESRVQPHFLFNALHTIAQLVRSRRSEEAMDVIDRLGQLLRSALEDRPPMIPLRDEIAFARAYLEIESVRFSDRLRVEWHVDGDVGDALVPALILQPLIENAVKHGIAPRAAGGTIRVRITRSGGTLSLEVEDDGTGFDAAAPSQGTGIGLGNTRERLAAAFGGDGRLETRRSRDGGAIVQLVMPCVITRTAEPVPA